MTDSGIGVPRRNPASVFLQLWLEVKAYGSTDYITRALPASKGFRAALKRTLQQGDMDAVLQQLNAFVLCRGATEFAARGRKLAIMEEIDEAFRPSHPRSMLFDPSRSRAPRRIAWIEECSQIRALNEGWYAECDGHRVIAQGPLLRKARTPLSISAESLLEYFSALSVVPTHEKDHDGKSVPVRARHFSDDGLYGCKRPPNPGREKILFVPVMERREDILCSEEIRNGRRFAGFVPAAHVDPATRLQEALSTEGPIDIAVAGEFTFTPAGVDSLSSRLQRKQAHRASVIIAGSGCTDEKDAGLAWNEASVLNGRGKLLWQQRKLWPAAILRDRAIEFGLGDPGEDKIHEDTASGAELVVADIDNVGRFVILICQDLENDPLASEIVKWYQPDWVISPILDRDASIGRWAHISSIAKSRVSRTRFLIACSTALAPDGSADPAPFALALGPLDADEDDAGRAVAKVFPNGTKPARGTLVWRADDGSWTRWKVATEN
jgi:hypothetical protein